MARIPPSPLSPARLWLTLRVCRLCVLPLAGTMVMTYGHTCASCDAEFTRGNSWNGRGETKYCHLRPCIRLGVERGDIVPRSMSKGASSRRPSPDGAEFFEGKNELLKLKEIVSARHFAAGRLRGEVAASNKIPSEERMLYLLVYGKFMRDVDDEEGGRGYYWMTVEQLYSQEKISAEVIKEARDDFRARDDALWVREE